MQFFKSAPVPKMGFHLDDQTREQVRQLFLKRLGIEPTHSDYESLSKSVLPAEQAANWYIDQTKCAQVVTEGFREILCKVLLF